MNHRVTSVTVNGLHLWECMCGRRWHPNEGANCPSLAAAPSADGPSAKPSGGASETRHDLTCALASSSACTCGAIYRTRRRS